MSRSPHSLLKVVSSAKLFEEKFLPLNPQSRNHGFQHFPKPLNQVHHKPLPTITISQPINTPLLPTLPKTTTLKKLSLAEIQFR